MAFTKAAKKSEMHPGTSKIVSINGKMIAVFNIGGSIHAISNACAHKGGPLGEGELEGKTVVCPWHGWAYDVTTGKCLTSPATVQKFSVKVEGDDILVDA